MRQNDVRKLPPWYRVAFRTKLEMAAELVTWAADCLRYLGKALWVVTDGAYAKRPFLKPGTYHFECTIHPGTMNLTVVVTR